MDYATKVTIVEKCKIEAKWTTDIDEGYGWQNTANGIEFNTKERLKLFNYNSYRALFSLIKYLFF